MQLANHRHMAEGVRPEQLLDLCAAFFSKSLSFPLGRQHPYLVPNVEHCSSPVSIPGRVLGAIKNGMQKYLVKAIASDAQLALGLSGA